MASRLFSYYSKPGLLHWVLFGCLGLPGCFEMTPQDPNVINCGYVGKSFVAKFIVETDCWPGPNTELVMKGKNPLHDGTEVPTVEVYKGTPRELRASVTYKGECLVHLQDVKTGVECEYWADSQQPETCFLPNGAKSDCQMNLNRKHTKWSATLITDDD